jgi:hypothetical protein
MLDPAGGISSSPDGSSGFPWAFLRLASISLSLLLLISSCSDEGGHTGSETPQEKIWTFMLYDAADIEDAYDPMGDFASRAESGADLNALVMQDTKDDSARIWYIGSGHAVVPVLELGEVNTGRPETLREFLEYSKREYPAGRYILAIYGHGLGWRGACLDESGGNDFLTMEEMASAIAAAGGVDLILFPGPCLMATLESVYELRNCSSVYVASEDLSFYCWWDHPMQDIFGMLNTDPGIGNLELGAYIIEAIREDSDRWSSYEWYGDLTMSAVRTDAVSELAVKLDSLALDYSGSPGRLRECMDSTGSDLAVFYEQYVDISDLAGGVLRFEQQDSTGSLLGSIRNCVGEAVLAECHGENREGAGGLSVYFPFNSHSGSSPLYGGAGCGLDFTDDTAWDELLDSYPYPPACRDVRGYMPARPGPPSYRPKRVGEREPIRSAAGPGAGDRR